jgi:hypothetical protein
MLMSQCNASITVDTEVTVRSLHVVSGGWLDGGQLIVPNRVKILTRIYDSWSIHFNDISLEPELQRNLYREINAISFVDINCLYRRIRHTGLWVALGRTYDACFSWNSDVSSNYTLIIMWFTYLLALNCSKNLDLLFDMSINHMIY